MNTFQKLVAVSLLIVSLSIAYYFVIFLPQKENLKTQMKLENGNKLNKCLIAASENMTTFWNKECASQRLSKDCILPEYNANRIDKLKKELRDLCFSRFPVNN